MKAVLIVVLIVAAVAFWLAMRARARAPETSNQLKNPANSGRDLRQLMLTTPPAQTGSFPTQEFPRIYAVLMDWPIDAMIATIFSTSTGSASLYTTSTFGIIGGEGHETVRTAATTFVRAADPYFDAAMPTTEYPYPTPDHVRFYFLTFDGVRVIDTDFASIDDHTSQYTQLFELGQAVLTELRLVTEKREASKVPPAGAA